MGRLSRMIVLAAIALSAAGCAAPESSKTASMPFLPGGRNATLRKQVEADSFPSAAQAGVLPSAK